MAETLVTESFEGTAINGQKWAKAIAVASTDITVFPNTTLAYSTGSGNYLKYVNSTVAITGVTKANPTVITALHGYAVSETFFVYIDGITTTTALNGWWLATATATTTFTIPIDSTTMGTPGFASAFVYLSSNVGSAEQRVEALVQSSTTGTTSFSIIWARLGLTAVPKSGYGAILTWNADATRTVQIAKINYATGAVDVVATSDDLAHLMRQENDSDLDVSQYLSLTVTDIPSKQGISDSQGVLCRAFLNTEDEGDPAVEWEDHGTSVASVAQPIYRDAGTFGLAFGNALTVFSDAFTGTYGYAIPEYGAHGQEGNTLAELREGVKLIVSQSAASNYEDATIDAMIRDAINEVVMELGDQALFLRKLNRMVLTEDNNGLITLPADVDRVDRIYRLASKEPDDEWRWVSTDPDGNIQIAMDTNPSGQTYLVRYFERWSPPVADGDYSPVPAKYSEAVKLAAALRLSGEYERDTVARGILFARYKGTIERFRKEMSRMTRQEKPRLHFRRKGFLGTRYAPAWQTQGPF